MKDRIKRLLKNNLITCSYFLFAIFFELISICFIGCFPLLTRPLYPLIIFGIFISFLLILKTAIFKTIFSSIFLIIQLIANIGFVYLYDSNGTFFEWSMVNQRDDAFATIEDLSLRWGLLAILIIGIVIHIIISISLQIFYYKSFKNTYIPIRARKYSRACFCLCTLFAIAIPLFNGLIDANKDYIDRYLYGNGENKYQQIGISSNAAYEFINGTILDAVLDYDTEGIKEFIYNDKDPYLPHSQYHGISKGNNLIYILVESFEWYPFLNNCTKEQSLQLYPNINKFMNNSLIANEFYAREKTDTAEMLALIGSNPTNKFINYDFPTNAYPWSLPNLFKNSVLNNGNSLKHVKSFHQNDGDFYNRNTLHESLGFDELVDIKDMAKFGMVNTWGEALKGERNLDSETAERMQNEMFPLTSKNEQYFTFWLTFVMHGYYVERETFKQAGYYDKMDSVGAYPAGISTKSDYLRTYAAAVMDFDKALGIMMSKLEENNQLENTTIVMFADHNTYYNNLSYYAKNIDERYNSELYRVPFMIYDKKLAAAYCENEKTNLISKFTTTSDMLPTILDIFGIQGYKNLYYGTSMFIKDVESVIFSRAYGIFITNKLICYSAEELIYKSKDYTQDDYDSFIKRAKILLKKQEYLDKIYYNDYFKNLKEDELSSFLLFYCIHFALL